MPAGACSRSTTEPLAAALRWATRPARWRARWRPWSFPDSRRGIAAIVALVEAHDVSTVVVGLPLRLDGGDSAQTRIAREFAALLESRLVGVEVVLHDERFTTRQARAGDGAASEDSRAAAHLLEAWLAMPAAE